MSGRHGSSGIMHCYRLDDSDFEIRWDKKPWCSSHLCRPALGLAQSTVKWAPGLVPGRKAAEAWRWPPIPPPTDYVKNERRHTSTPLLCHSMGCYSMTFTFTRLHIVIIIREVPFLLSFFLVLTSFYLPIVVAQGSCCICSYSMAHPHTHTHTHTHTSRDLP